MDQQGALRAFRVLAAAAAVDGKMSQPEMQLLVRKAKEMRLQPSDVQQILSDAREGRLPVALPQDPRDFNERLNEIIEVVCADGRLETTERGLLLRFASRMMLSETDLMARVRPQLQAAQERVAERQRAPQAARPVPVPPPVAVAPPAPVAAPRPEPQLKTYGPGMSVAPTISGESGKPAPRPAAVTRTPQSVGAARPDEQLRTFGPGMSVAPTISGEQHALTFTPGPVTLMTGSSLGASVLGSDISPIMLQLLRSQLEHGTIEEVVHYAQTYLNLKDAAEARRVIEKVLRDHPDIKVGAQRLHR